MVTKRGSRRAGEPERRKYSALNMRTINFSVPVVASLFLEDVTAWLELHDIRFTPNVKFTGRSGYDHTFDFVVPASGRAPERLIRAVNRPSRDLAEAMAFAWVDTKEVRPTASKFPHS